MSSESGVWDDTVANALLSSHDYRGLDALLREHVDKLRSPEAVDWLHTKAYDGDVIVIYHLVRNMAKCSVPSSASCGGSGSAGNAPALGLIRVLSGEEFRSCFQWYLFLLLRIAQDMLSLSVIQGTTPSAALFAAFRDKIGTWLRNQFPEPRWPALGNVAEIVRRGMVCCSDVTMLPLPVWVLTCSRSFASSYFNIGSTLYFENPTPALIDACKRTISPLNVERERIRNAFFTLVREITWQGLAGLNVSAFITPPAYSPHPTTPNIPPLCILETYAEHTSSCSASTTASAAPANTSSGSASTTASAAPTSTTTTSAAPASAPTAPVSALAPPLPVESASSSSPAPPPPPPPPPPAPPSSPHITAARKPESPVPVLVMDSQSFDAQPHFHHKKSKHRDRN
jgi:hypothetical protein